MHIKKTILALTAILTLSACGQNSCEHIDNNHDGICDKCNYQGVSFSHIDHNKDHVCDVCGRTYTNHTDKNNDHVCDICDEIISEHQTGEHSHYCSICGNKITEHNFVVTVPENQTHTCTICNEVVNCTDSNEDGKCDVCGGSVTKITHEAPFKGGIVIGSKYIGYEFEKENVSRPTTGVGTVEIFGFNDFHGAVNANESEGETGLAKYASFIKQMTSKENTLCFDQGDTWQGTLESNYQYGKVIQDAMTCADVSLRTLGNHDLDWSIEKYKEISSRKYGDYSIPTLAANVFDYNWDSKTIGTTQQTSIGKEYATFTMENGLKIGVVGVIGDEQITTISTQFARNIIFTNHINKIKEISDFLRTEKSCDIVVASVHGDKSETLSKGLTNVSVVSGKRYVDLVLNAHTHRNECEIENNVIFSQFGRNSENIGSVKLKYDFSTNEVLPSTQNDRSSYNAKYLRTFYPTDDKEIKGIVDNYLYSIKDLATEIIATNFTGTFASDNALPNLMSEAIYWEAKNEGYTVDLSLVNYSRDSFNKTTMTYSDLYKAFPFDNEVIIYEASGSTAKSTIKRNFSYHEDKDFVFNTSTKYLIAGIDYLALHTNEARNYDFFPNAIEISRLESQGKTLTYRDILKKYLSSGPKNSFNASDYDSSNWQFEIK